MPRPTLIDPDSHDSYGYQPRGETRAFTQGIDEMGVLAPFTRAWQFRELIKAILGRELASRFAGSAFGWAWAVAAPLVMMFTYTVVFSGILVIANTGQHTTFGERALVVFTGMTVFN